MTDSMVVSRRGMLRAAGVAAVGMVVGAARSRAGAATAGAATGPAAGGRVHRVLTCNILLDLPEHKGTPMDWPAQRREVCLELIRSRKPDVVCTQEMGWGQNGDFVRAFEGFDVFGYSDPYVDKRPPRFQAIKNVILYSRERYERVVGGTYWLSETPGVAGSKLAGEGLPRHVTWVRLKDRVTGREFRVLDTHWGLKQPQRELQAKILAAETAKYPDDFPQILCGDFNSAATSNEQRELLNAGWRDTYAAVHGEDVATAATRAEGAAGPATQLAATRPAGRKIDFVFYRGAVRPVGADVFRSGDKDRPASDHPFVSADVEI